MCRPGGEESGGGSVAEALGCGRRRAPGCRSRPGADPRWRGARARRPLSAPRPLRARTWRLRLVLRLLWEGWAEESCCHTPPPPPLTLAEVPTHPARQELGGKVGSEGTLSFRSPGPVCERPPRRCGGYSGSGGGGGAGAVDSSAGAGRVKVGEKGRGRSGSRSWGREARAGFGGEGGLHHVTGRRPRYRLTVRVTSPSSDCRGWHFRSLPHLFFSSPQ